MEEIENSSLGNENMTTSIRTELQHVIKSSRLIEGSINRYILNTTNLIIDKHLQRERFGVKDEKKPHKTILLVGETGVGKSTLINAMINYLLGVRCNDKIWCEVIESKEEQVDSKTEIVTVYDVFIKESPVSLTIIDSPGFGSTKGKKTDLEINKMIHELCSSPDGVQEINVVGLVVSSATARLTDNQLYVFDAVLSLFGCDVEKNIVLFVTQAPTNPHKAIKAIKKSKIPCAKNDKGEPVYFRFHNSHCEDFSDEDVLDDYEVVWNVLNNSMENFLFFLNGSKTVSLKLTKTVLRKRKQLTSLINSLKDLIKTAELKKTELEQTNAALREHEKQKTNMNNFEYEVVEDYKELVPIDNQKEKEATYCLVCKENCHYPGCWWVRDLSWCSVMKNGKCTVCIGKCDFDKHKKTSHVYEKKTRKVKKTMEDLKNTYEKGYKDYMSLITTLETKIREQETERIRLVDECYQCVMSLDEIALQSLSESTLQHLGFLIERVKETGNTQRVQKLEDLKKRAETEHQNILAYRLNM